MSNVKFNLKVGDVTPIAEFFNWSKLNFMCMTIFGRMGFRSFKHNFVGDGSSYYLPKFHVISGNAPTNCGLT